MLYVCMYTSINGYYRYMKLQVLCCFLLVCLQVKLLKKGLRKQAEGVLTLSNQCQQLYAAQVELIDLLPNNLPLPLSEEAEREKEGVCACVNMLL